MGGTKREYQAIVSIMGSTEPPLRLTIEAHDADDARAQIVARFGDQIINASVWNEEELAKTWTRPRPDNTLREFTAIVWTKDPAVVGRRLIVEARDIEEAKRLAKEEFGEEADFCYAWNEEDRNKAR
jgi:hypothetical protein